MKLTKRIKNNKYTVSEHNGYLTIIENEKVFYNFRSELSPLQVVELSDSKFINLLKQA